MKKKSIFTNIIRRIFLRFRVRKNRRNNKVRYSRNVTSVQIGKNPYRRKHVFSIRTKVQILGIFLSIVVFFSLILYHPFFALTKVSISGLQRIEETNIRNTVESVLNYKKFFVLPGSSYVIADVGNIREVLIDKYPLATLSVKKSFPNSLSISIQEKITTVIFDNGSLYSYIGLDGRVVEIVGQVTDSEWEETYEVTTTTLADGTKKTEKKLVERIHTPAVDSLKRDLGSFPIVYDPTHIEVEINTKAMEESDVRGIIDWFNESQRLGIGFRYAKVAKSGGEADILTNSGWRILALLTNVKTQVEQFNFVLDQKINTDNAEYVDLRYPGRVYWQ
jgi:hypothetical protein